MQDNNTDRSGFPPNPIAKPGYRLEFNDNFEDEVDSVRGYRPIAM